METHVRVAGNYTGGFISTRKLLFSRHAPVAMQLQHFSELLQLRGPDTFVFGPPACQHQPVQVYKLVKPLGNGLYEAVRYPEGGSVTIREELVYPVKVTECDTEGNQVAFIEYMLYVPEDRGKTCRRAR